MSIFPLTIASATESFLSYTMSYGDLKKHNAKRIQPKDCIERNAELITVAFVIDN